MSAKRSTPTRTDRTHLPGATRLAAARRAIAVVFCASGFDTGVWASQIPRIKSALSLDDAALSTVVLAFAIGAIVTMPLAGALVTRLGGMRTVLLAGIASACGLALLGMASGYSFLLGAAVFAGMALGGLDVAMNTQASAVERAWERPIMSRIHGWFSLGGLAGAAAGGALTDASLSIRAVLVAAGAVTLVATIAPTAWLAVPGQPASEPGLAWPRRAVLGIGLLCLLALLIEGAVFDWTAVYMHEVAGASLGFASAGVGGFSLGVAAPRVAGAGLARRGGKARGVGVGAALLSSGVAIACAIPHPLAVTSGLTLAGLGEANIVPLLFSAAGRVPGVAPGAGVAMVATMGYGAFLLGPPVIGMVADVAGLRVALLLPALCGLAIAGRARAVLASSARDEG